MAYSSAIFYVDYLTGSNAARTALTSVSFTWNAGTSKMRATKNSHGLVTGAVVDITGTTGLNAAWKITQIDVNTFDLDTSTNISNTSGTVTPRGGSSWTDAWKDGTNGATSARRAGDDEVRFAKSPPPSSIGTALWTNLSKVITLTTAQTANIDMCESAWTAANSGVVTLTGVATDAKEGSNCMKIAAPASPATGTLYAYFSITPGSLSSYQKISLWIKNSAVILNTHWKICLCSNTNGTGIIDEFLLPAIPSTGAWVPLTITKSGGGNLGASTASIALYSGSVAPTGSSNLLLDNIIACTTSGLNLQSLISKNTLEQSTISDANYGNEAWYAIKSINGTAINIDNAPATKSNAGRGYTGNTETVTTYIRETIQTLNDTGNNTNLNVITTGGTLGHNVIWSGGWNKATNLQDGETFFDGLNGIAYCFYFNGSSAVSPCSYNSISMFAFYRYNTGLVTVNATHFIVSFISNANSCNVTGIIISSSCNINIISILNCNNNVSYGISLGSTTNLYANYIRSISGNNGRGIYYNLANNCVIDTIASVNYNNGEAICILGGFDNIINNLTTLNNVGGAIFPAATSKFIIRNASISETTKLNPNGYVLNSKIYINNIGGYFQFWTETGNIISQNATAGGTGIEWKISPTNTLRNILYPLDFPVCRIPVTANKLVTVTLYFKKSHATDIGAKLVCKVNQVSWSDGTANVETIAPSDTSRNQLQIQFTPTAVGNVEILAMAYWIANGATQSVIIDDINITQAS